MTVKKAIANLEFLIKKKQELKDGLFDPEESWNKGEPTISGFVNTIATILQRDIDWLQAIKKHLLPEQHRTKIVCRHPKKMHDTSPDGQKYCMNCNADLN